MDESPQDALQQAIKVMGNQTALARKLGIAPAAVSQWTRSRVPAQRVLEVEKATGIPKERLRPDLYPPAKEAAE